LFGFCCRVVEKATHIDSGFAISCFCQFCVPAMLRCKGVSLLLLCKLAGSQYDTPQTYVYLSNTNRQKGVGSHIISAVYAQNRKRSSVHNTVLDYSLPHGRAARKAPDCARSPRIYFSCAPGTARDCPIDRRVFAPMCRPPDCHQSYAPGCR